LVFVCVASLGARAQGKETELKISLNASQANKLLALLGTKAESALYRQIYFLDTPGLGLFNEGSVLRTRSTLGGLSDGADDATVKLRPLESSVVDKKWFGLPGFKCERDETMSQAVTSCSMTEEISQKKIDGVAMGARPATDLFTPEQLTFLQVYAQSNVPWDRVVALGPIRSRTWKAGLKDFETELTVEEWTLPNATRFLELSTKVKSESIDEARKTLSEYLAKHKLTVGEDQETKTRLALEYLAPKS
jgi:hypothetical protein